MSGQERWHNANDFLESYSDYEDQVIHGTDRKTARKVVNNTPPEPHGLRNVGRPIVLPGPFESLKTRIARVYGKEEQEGPVDF